VQDVLQLKTTRYSDVRIYKLGLQLLHLYCSTQAVARDQTQFMGVAKNKYGGAAAYITMHIVSK